MRLVGRDEQMGRDLYLSVCDDLRTWSPDLTRLPPFVALCAFDADTEDDQTLEAFASRLMAAGCYYVCAWGSGCERVHDLVDDVLIRENAESAKLPAETWDETFVMTTWHERDTLDEAVWYAIFTAISDEHENSTVLAVASPRYADQVERRLTDTERLSLDVVGEESG